VGGTGLESGKEGSAESDHYRVAGLETDPDVDVPRRRKRDSSWLVCVSAEQATGARYEHGAHVKDGEQVNRVCPFFSLSLPMSLASLHSIPPLGPHSHPPSMCGRYAWPACLHAYTRNGKFQFVNNNHGIYMIDSLPPKTTAPARGRTW
jgi:hypothetical protein